MTRTAKRPARNGATAGATAGSDLPASTPPRAASTRARAATPPSSTGAAKAASSAGGAERHGAAKSTAKVAARKVALVASAFTRLWTSYRRRPLQATRNRLVEAYQPVVREMVRRFALRLPRSVDRGDLETAAAVGLMAAIEGFDPERGVRFESYCELRVRGALLDELRSQDWLPRPWRQRLEQHKRVVERLRSELGEEPSEDLVAEALDMAPDEYRQLFGLALPGAPTGSMPLVEGGEESGPSLDVVPDPAGGGPGEKLTRDELLGLVTQRLSEQEHRILYLKYWEDLPMREIGQLTKLSESRVCKIHARLLERLKDRLRSQGPG